MAFAADQREDILRAADVMLEAGIHIETGPHKHAIQQTFFLYVYEPGGNRIELCNAGARLVLAPDWRPISWSRAERAKGQAWGLKTIDSFHTHGTPPVDVAGRTRPEAPGDGRTGAGRADRGGARARRGGRHHRPGPGGRRGPGARLRPGRARAARRDRGHQRRGRLPGRRPGAEPDHRKRNGESPGAGAARPGRAGQADGPAARGGPDGAGGLSGAAGQTVYADANTASAGLKQGLAATADQAGVPFADIALMAPVPGRGLHTPMVVSGPAAEDVARLLGACGATVSVLPGPAGAAATRKLLRSVFYKGMAAAAIEALHAARAAGCEDWLREHIAAELAAADAGTLARLERGSYQHARRREHEMAAATDLLNELVGPAAGGPGQPAVA